MYNIIDIVIELSSSRRDNPSVIFLALHFRIILSQANNSTLEFASVIVLSFHKTVR